MNANEKDTIKHTWEKFIFNSPENVDHLINQTWGVTWELHSIKQDLNSLSV